MLRAAKADPAAVEGLYRRYRRPVLHFLRKRAARPTIDLEVVADQVMQTMLAPAFLAQVEKSKGRFRDLLMAVSRHALSNANRSDLVHNPPGLVSLEDLQSDPPATEGERHDFDVLYAKEVIGAAWERLDQEADRIGSLRAKVMRLRVDQQLTQEEIAETLKLPITTVNNHLARGRARLREFVGEMLSPFCSSQRDLDVEVDFLLAVLSEHGKRRARRDR